MNTRNENSLNGSNFNGFSSFSSSVNCRPCAKGTFAAFNGSTCKSCPKEFFQSQEGSTQCLKCPSGYIQPNTGESACMSLNWVYPEDCTSEQFLNDTGNRTSWKCEVCLKGASCHGPVKLSDLPNMFGWWNIPNTHKYVPCLYPPACLGGPNPTLVGKYLDVDGNDLSQTNGTGCAVDLGFRNASRLCHTCASHNRRKGSSECVKCPTSGQNWGLIILGVAIIFSVLVIVLRMSLHRKSDMKVSQGVKKIMLNYLQVIALAKSFPLSWNDVLRTLFEVQGAISTLGEHIVNVDCISTSKSAAELFYGKQVMYIFLPVITGFLGFIFWFSYGMMQGY